MSIMYAYVSWYGSSKGYPLVFPSAFSGHWRCDLVNPAGPQPMGQPAWLFSIVKVPKVPKENNTSKEMRHWISIKCSLLVSNITMSLVTWLWHVWIYCSLRTGFCLNILCVSVAIFWHKWPPYQWSGSGTARSQHSNNTFQPLTWHGLTNGSWCPDFCQRVSILLDIVCSKPMGKYSIMG